MEIALLRHGKPAGISNVSVSASQFGHWIASYNSAGVAESSVPPQASLEYARTCGVVITSNLLRSVQSGEFLHVKNYQAPDNLFAEAGMPYATWVTLKLPPKYWAVLFRVLWYLGYSKTQRVMGRRVKDQCWQLVSLLIWQNPISQYCLWGTEFLTDLSPGS